GLARQAGGAERLRVEPGLQVLQLQGEVEDTCVLRRRGVGERLVGDPGAHDSTGRLRAATDDRPAKHVRSRRFGRRRVGVHLCLLQWQPTWFGTDVFPVLAGYETPASGRVWAGTDWESRRWRLAMVAYALARRVALVLV